MKEITLASKWKALWASNSRYFVCTGGRGSGKSFAVTYFLIDLIRSESGHVVLFSRKTMTSARSSIIPVFLEMLELIGIENEFEITAYEIIHKESGSKIWFKGLQSGSKDNTANLKSMPITTWVLDEAEELTDLELFRKVDLSIRTKGRDNRIILILNPTTKEHFIYKRFFVENGINASENTTQGNTTAIHTTYLDNIENCSKSFLDEIEWIKANKPEEYKHVILGGWREAAEGVIFTNWETGEFQDIGPSYYGLDFGFKDPDAMVEVKIDSNNRIMYVRELIYANGLSTSDLKRLIQTHVTNNDMVIADSANPKTIMELQQSGFNVLPSVKGADSVRAGIRVLQDYKMIVSPTSTNLVTELNNYVWHDTRSETPVDDYNHLLDALRYATRHLSLNIVTN